ncbi:hypothetical protein ACWGJB_34995 [Streptomyces sp. NPDC054813]
MHVVIAWWDTRRNAEAGTARPYPSGKAGAFAGDFPGLCTSQWITHPVADLQGLALIWDSAASADLSLPAISERMFGCAPSHRWVFEVSGTTSPHGDAPGLPAELDLLLHA